MIVHVTLQVRHDATDPTSDPKDCTLDLNEVLLHELRRTFTTVKIVDQDRQSLILEVPVYVEDSSKYRVED